MPYTGTHLAKLSDVKDVGTDLKSEIDEAASKRTLTFIFPDMGINTPLTIDWHNCEFFYIDLKFDIVVIDAENKIVLCKEK